MAPGTIPIQGKDSEMNPLSSLDLRAENCDLTIACVVESHFLLEYDVAISRHTDMILS